MTAEIKVNIEINSDNRQNLFDEFKGRDDNSIHNFFTQRQARHTYKPLLAGKDSINELYGILQPDYDYYCENTLKTNPVIFDYLSTEQKNVKNQELLCAFHLLATRYELELAESRHEALKNLANLIANCAYLIDKANAQKNGSIEKINKRAHDERLIKNFSATTETLNVIGWINGWRFYWVWLSNFLAATIGAIKLFVSSNWYNIENAAKALRSIPARILNWLSVVLYPIRLFIYGFLILKHAFTPSDAEKKILPAVKDRFNKELNKTKFAILNDQNWVIVNALTFAQAPWKTLTGNSWAGWSGNLLTVLLLIGDTSLTIWNSYEKRAQHVKNLQHIDNKLRSIESKIGELLNETDVKNSTDNINHINQLKDAWDEKENLAKINQHKSTIVKVFEAAAGKHHDKAIREIETKIRGLEKAIQKSNNTNANLTVLFEQQENEWKKKDLCELNWKFKAIQLAYNIRFIAVLTIGMIVLTNLLIIPTAAILTAAVAANFYLAGSTMLIVPHVILEYFGASLAITQSRETRDAKITNAINIINKCREDTYLNEEDRFLAQKKAYIEVTQLLEEAEHLDKKANYQMLHCVRSTVITAIAPAILLVGFTFTGFGFAIAAATIVVALLAHLIIELKNPDKKTTTTAINKDASNEHKDNFKKELANKEKSAEGVLKDLSLFNKFGISKNIVNNKSPVAVM